MSVDGCVGHYYVLRYLHPVGGEVPYGLYSGGDGYVGAFLGTFGRHGDYPYRGWIAVHYVVDVVDMMDRYPRDAASGLFRSYVESGHYPEAVFGKP